MYNVVERACGKPVWKTLWRMWKSWGFPQVKREFSNGSGEKVVHNLLYKCAQDTAVTMLRHQKKTATKTRKMAKKFEKHGHNFHTNSCRYQTWEKFL